MKKKQIYPAPPPRWWAVLQALAIYAWLTVLSPLSVTDTYYSVYLLCGSLGLVCMWDNRGTLPGKAQFLGGILFSVAVVAANYALYTPLSVLQNLFDLALLLAGGFVVGTQVLTWMANHLPLENARDARSKPEWVFLFCFAVIAAVDLTYLFFVRYPGALTVDSFKAMHQILGLEPYDNYMPFWYTMTVGLFVNLGMLLFQDINAAVALSIAMQILFMAVCMAYVVTTLYQMGAHRGWIVFVFLIYAFTPNNIAFSVLMWKDVIFGGAAALMVTAMYRLFKNLGKRRWLNDLAFVAGAAGLCLWRTNGWYAFAVTTVVTALFLGRRHRKMVLRMAAICLVCWLLIGPALSFLQVEGRVSEAFSVPMQQIARVITMGRPIFPEEEALLREAFWVDDIPELYNPNHADAIKGIAFRIENQDYIAENWMQYLLLYLRLALRYPGDFFQAWVEQTKGYWNAGYRYWAYILEFGENKVGLVQIQGDNLIARAYAALFRYLEKPEILQCITSIGLHSWALGACAVTTAAKKREEFALTVPILVLILGLCLGTPVHAEYRYAYPMIMSMPMILSATMYQPRENQPAGG